MAESTIEDLQETPTTYRSSRARWDVLIGEDKASPVIKAISSGDNAALQSLLSQPQWIKTMFEEPHFIFDERRQSQAPGDVREVSAMPMSTLARAIIIAADDGQAAVMSTLLNFAAQQGLKPSSVIMRWAVSKAIWNGHAAVYEAFVQADPEMVNFSGLGHSTSPLYEALRVRRPEVVAVLLKHGADVLHPVGHYTKMGSYNSSLLSRAAMCQGPRAVELLLEHDIPIAGSAALHTAAAFGQFETVRLLMDHGADVNERISVGWKGWTPMHFAARNGRTDAMEFLESCGAQSDAKDDDGKTAAQVLEECAQERVERERRRQLLFGEKSAT